MTIDLTFTLRSLAFYKSGKHRRTLQHVDVIVSTGHSKKKSMSNPQIIVCHCFKYNTAQSKMSSFMHLLLSECIILPPPMHAIDAPEHPRKTSRFTYCHDQSCVFSIWLSYILWSKHHIHRLAKLVSGLNDCFRHTEVVVQRIYGVPIYARHRITSVHFFIYENPSTLQYFFSSK